MLHGWPSDPHDYDGVVPPLADAGCRVLTPWLRGYGPTRFLDPATPRSGQQAALGADLRDFMDALGIGQAILGGYDWGGRAACVVAALWPERARGLVSITGYNIQNIPASGDRPRRRPSCVTGTSGISRPNAAAPACGPTAAILPSCSGASGRRTGNSTTQRSRKPPQASTTRISSRSPSTPIATVSSTHQATQRWKTWRPPAAQPAIGVPTIVLQGEADGVTPPEGSEHVAHTSPRATNTG